MDLPVLEYSERCVRFVDYADLERFIVKVYGIFETSPHQGIKSKLGFRDFSIIAMIEWGNNQYHSFDVARGTLNKWEKKDLKEFMDWPFSTNYILHLLLKDMCNNSHIEPGEYIVQVYW